MLAIQEEAIGYDQLTGLFEVSVYIFTGNDLNPETDTFIRPPPAALQRRWNMSAWNASSRRN